MRLFMIAACAALSLSACAPMTGANNSTSNVSSVADQVDLKATTALSLAELAYNSAEATATAALKGSVNGQKLTPAQAQQLGAYVHQARAYRDQARSLVAAGSDASAVLEALNGAIGNIKSITG